MQDLMNKRLVRQTMTKRTALCYGNVEIMPIKNFVDAKEQEALFTFMGVQNKLIKKHFWRDLS
jgi:hypothetical protein